MQIVGDKSLGKFYQRVSQPETAAGENKQRQLLNIKGLCGIIPRLNLSDEQGGKIFYFKSSSLMEL